jgi:hypothetical protein
MSKNGNGKAEFSAQLLVLTYDSAELLVREQPVGKGLGVLAMEFIDNEAYRARDTRAPDERQQPRLADRPALTSPRGASVLRRLPGTLAVRPIGACGLRRS